MYKFIASVASTQQIAVSLSVQKNDKINELD